MTLRRFSSAKNEGLSLIALPGNSFSRPTPCSEDRRASCSTTDQPEGPASRYRDYPSRFVTTRKLFLFRHARCKPARFDSPALGCWRLGRPKPRRLPFDLCARIAQGQVRNGGSFRPVCPDTKECERGWSAARSQADLAPLPVDPASQPHPASQHNQSPAPRDRSRSDSQEQVLWRASVRSNLRQTSIP